MITQYTYSELQKEKIRIRNSDPVKFTCLTMIMTGASNKAKEEHREVTSDDLLNSLKSEIKNSEKAIEVITSHSGDASKQMGELEMYKTFLPQMMPEDEVKKLVSEFLSTSKMENMGKTIAAFKEKNAEKMPVIDMKIVSSLIKQAF